MNEPIRTCVGCFQKFPQKQLLAITRLKNGDMVVDKDAPLWRSNRLTELSLALKEHKAAGRSVYLCYKKSCMDKARKRKGKNAVEYGLKVPVANIVWETIEQLICTT